MVTIPRDDLGDADTPCGVFTNFKKSHAALLIDMILPNTTTIGPTLFVSPRIRE